VAFETIRIGCDTLVLAASVKAPIERNRKPGLSSGR